MFLGVLNTAFLNISNKKSYLELRICTIQNVSYVIIPNLVEICLPMLKSKPHYMTNPAPDNFESASEPKLGIDHVARNQF